MGEPMRFTTFDSIKDNVPHPYEGWDTFAELFELKVTENKHDVPLYCPAEYVNQRRLMENVLHVSFGVIDVDSFPEDAVEEALEYLTDELDLAVIFHTTHSHYAGLKEGKYKCRMILKFSRPVQMHEWDRVWQGMNTLVGGIADEQCKNPNAIYYFPSCPPNAESTARVEVLNPEGQALDIEELLEAVPKAEKKQSFIPEVDEETLKRIDVDTRAQLANAFLTAYPPAIQGSHGDAQTLRAAMIGGDFGLSSEEFWPLLLAYNDRCAPPWDEEDLAKKLSNAERYRSLPHGWRLVQYGLGDAVQHKHIKKLAERLGNKGDRGKYGRWLEIALTVKDGKGQPIGAGPGQIFSGIADVLANEYPEADPVQLSLHMEKCITATQVAGHRDITVDHVAELIRQAQKEIQEKKAAARTDRSLLRRSQMEDAFRSIGVEGRTTPYSQEEIEAFAKNAGCSNKAQFQRRWVIRYNKSFYFFVGGQYTRPYAECEAANAARADLLPSGISLTRPGKNGPVPLSMSEIVDFYGTIANAVEIDLTAQHSFYDAKRKVLVEAPRHPLRLDIKPTWHACVDRWLCSFTEDEELTEDLMDWLACVPYIEEPLCGLCIHGRPQVGKSLLADGLARLWIPQGSASPLEDIVPGEWNSIIVEDGCPIMLADESLPKDRNNQPRTDFLRRIVQARTQTLRRKMIPNATLKGCVRVVVAVNDLNRELVPRNSDLTDADIAAISERLLCIKVRKRNDRPLEALAAIRNDPELRHAFFKGDMIAEHVAWLHENRKVEYGPRFLVEGKNNSELVMELVTSSGMRSEICHWLARFITKTKDIAEINANHKPFVDRGRDGRARLVLTAQAMHGLWSKYLPDGMKPQIGTLQRTLGGLSSRVKKGTDWYRQVELKYVKYWAVTRGICNSEEEFDRHLLRHGLKTSRLNIYADGDDE